MTILMAYASKHGSTREIAEAIAEELRSAGHDVDVRNVQYVNALDSYEAVIVGSALYAGNWLSEAKKFVGEHEKQLAARPLWLFSSGPLGAEDTLPQEEIQGIGQIIVTTAAREHQIFEGKLQKEALSLGEKIIVRAVKAPYGDYRDWDAIRAWAREIAADLERSASAKT